MKFYNAQLFFYVLDYISNHNYLLGILGGELEEVQVGPGKECCEVQ